MSVLFASVLTIAVAVFALPAFFGDKTEAIIAADLEKTDGLPVVGSFEKLKLLLEKESNMRGYAEGEIAIAVMESASNPSSGSADRAANISTTNVQVQGVDEADIVKTDGTYLYQTTDDEIRIARIFPAGEMSVLSRISYANGTFRPQEMYVDEKWMVVIGHSNQTIADTGHSKSTSARRIAEPTYVHYQIVTAMVYDITDKQQPRLVRELELEGDYLSSRKIGSNLYLVTNSFINTHRVLEQNEEVLPIYRDKAKGDDYLTVPYSDIHYFPENPSSNYLLVAGVDLNDADKKPEVKAYLGAGDSMYASHDNLYVTVTKRMYRIMERPILPFSTSAPADEEETTTTVYRFALGHGTLSYTGKGVVPGRILNQFSMDEHDGYFRIATTTGNMWRTDEGTSKNNLYTLDQNLNISGKLEGIAPGEKIYSVRFMGDRAYMVTFRTVDPLFVIDLKKPEAPSILGQLKIPGYSDYLHPYDENHLIGFGKEAIAEKDVAYYQGMKVALFDVSDVSNPVEKFVTVIGDRGTDSELLHNHKALLFSKENNLLAFPVTVTKLSELQKAKNQVGEYGSFQFQGAYIYNLDLQRGFQLASTVTHLSPEEIRKAGDAWYQSENNVRRILLLDDTLYTVSDSMVKAQQLSNHQPLGTLVLTNSR